MRLAIIGADGFVGRAVSARLHAMGFDGEVRLVDRKIAPHDIWETLEIDLTQTDALDLALEGVDRVLYLAALPGGAAEQDPQLSHKINLDLPLNLFGKMQGRRLIYTSSIAVFGENFPEHIDDASPPAPGSVYGTHKRMVELAFADAVRRKMVSGFALRLPGIVARPPSAAGFGSAFLSDIFHAAPAGTPLVLPVAADATSWLMSSEICAQNLTHALLGDASHGDAITLGAVRAQIGELIASLAKNWDMDGISFDENPVIRRLFGSHPPLDAQRAKHYGFVDDISVDTLVGNVMPAVASHTEMRNFA